MELITQTEKNYPALLAEPYYPFNMWVTLQNMLHPDWIPLSIGFHAEQHNAYRAAQKVAAGYFKYLREQLGSDMGNPDKYRVYFVNRIEGYYVELGSLTAGVMRNVGKMIMVPEWGKRDPCWPEVQGKKFPSTFLATSSQENPYIETLHPRSKPRKPPEKPGPVDGITIVD
ncbi:MAG: hypothetical protein LBQ12_06790 [Deltaproteobacteria bacterium]|jgi:hypothetical protein|nr:hypothetical protein [Deltaproteobacteria bacterium]